MDTCHDVMFTVLQSGPTWVDETARAYAYARKGEEICRESGYQNIERVPKERLWDSADYEDQPKLTGPFLTQDASSPHSD